MILSLYDNELLDKILPFHCEAYLKHNDWSKLGIRKDSQGPVESAWEKSINDKAYRIFVPLDTELSDYKFSIVFLIEKLKKLEERNYESIICDLLNANTDTFRVIVYKDQPEVNLSFKKADTLLEAVYEMFASASQAVYEMFAHRKPKSVYSFKKPLEVENFLNALKLGHTERGSFIITIHGPALSPRINTLFEDNFEDESFERSSMIKIPGLINLAQKLSIDPSVANINEAVNDGLSANFCEALANATDVIDKGIHFNFSWASIRPPLSNWIEKNNFYVRSDESKTIREIGKNLKVKYPEYDVEVKGHIIKLDRDKDAETGKITVLDENVNPHRKVIVELNKDDYKKSTDAHRDCKAITIQGDIEKKSSKLIMLNNSSNFKIVER